MIWCDDEEYDDGDDGDDDGDDDDDADADECMWGRCLSPKHTVEEHHTEICR